jgi:hypothetical protein
MSSNKGPSFPTVPISFILLLLTGAGIFWWFQKEKVTIMLPNGRLNGETIKLLKVPTGGSLLTSGLTKTEMLSRSDKHEWRGTTSSKIRVDATYRYEIELRSDWNFGFDEQRKIAFVLAPKLKPQLPVAVDTSTLQEETNSGWARFDKEKYLTQLRQEISPFLEAKAVSKDYVNLVRGDARKTVEQFVSDWILKEKGWRESDRPIVEVYFEDEENIPFPTGKSYKNFIP